MDFAVEITKDKAVIAKTADLSWRNMENAKEFFMRKAILQAKKAEEKGEVPIGAVIVFDGRVIATGYNRRETKHMATGHAELLAIEKANRIFMDWRLEECDLYVTLEPCPMCMGAAMNARIRNVYFGAYDPQSGVCGSKMHMEENNLCNHNINAEGGVLEEECRALLTDYFKKVRAAKKW